ncbi:TPA: hypothetical protein SAY52_004856 [Burkholderia cenocepacia]|uniref:hypothetical protein n=1 Tax=unclassified Burkholderia TaxID=2613784 RepID=UPI00158BE191|nr:MULTISPECIES: hypothetical protein [unclassified Burkholderia]HEF5874189.1 hypothetical protein [Burkholderia cenocepacia]
MDELKGLLRYYRYCPRILSLHIFGALIAWFAPADVLVRYKILADFVSWAGRVFPVVNEAAEKSAFPGVMGLYFSIMYALLPVRIFDSARAFYVDRGHTVAIIKKSFFKRVILSVGVVFFFVFGVAAVLFGRPYYEINVLPISESRFLLGLIGPIFAGGAEGFGVAAGIAWIFIFFSWVFFKIKR